MCDRKPDEAQFAYFYIARIWTKSNLLALKVADLRGDITKPVNSGNPCATNKWSSFPTKLFFAVIVCTIRDSFPFPIRFVEISALLPNSQSYMRDLHVHSRVRLGCNEETPCMQQSLLVDSPLRPWTHVALQCIVLQLPCVPVHVESPPWRVWQRQSLSWHV